MDPVSHKPIQSGTFIYFIKVRQRLAAIESVFTIAAFYRWSSLVVECAFDEIAGGHQIFETLLVLNADRVASKIISDSNGSNVHFTLQANLFIGEMFCMLFSDIKLHSFIFHPISYSIGLSIGDLGWFVVQRWLTESFFKNASWI